MIGHPFDVPNLKSSKMKRVRCPSIFKEPQPHLRVSSIYSSDADLFDWRCGLHLHPSASWLACNCAVGVILSFLFKILAPLVHVLVWPVVAVRRMSGEGVADKCNNCERSLVNR